MMFVKEKSERNRIERKLRKATKRRSSRMSISFSFSIRISESELEFRYLLGNVTEVDRS